jgi:UDP-N-acetyl-D-glucosamine dehydrogenase
MIDSAKTIRFDFMPYDPGLGGHCIPLGLYYCSWNAGEYDLTTRFIELAAVINSGTPYYVVEGLVSALSSHKKA